MQIAAEKTELNRAKTIAENKLQKKKEVYKDLQEQYTAVIKQYQQQIRINSVLGNKITEIMSMVNTKEGFEKLQSSPNLKETFGVTTKQKDDSGEMEFSGIENVLNQSRRER